MCSRDALPERDVRLAGFSELFLGDTGPLEVPAVVTCEGFGVIIDQSNCLQGSCCFFHLAEGGSCRQPGGPNGAVA